MCGGGDNGASNRAEQRELAERARVQAGIAQTNAVFNSPERQRQIAQFTDAVRAQYQEELQRVKGENDRQLTFALARGGNSGGSLEVDQRRQLGEGYQRGTIEAERGAQGAAAQLRAADEDAKNRIIAMIQAGANIGDTNSGTAMQNNLQATRSTVDVRTIGDAFGSLGDIYKRSRERAEYRRGLQDYGNLYLPTTSFAFGGNSGGRG